MTLGESSTLNMIRIRSSAIFLAVSLSFGSLPAADVDTALIESVVLINFDAFSDDSPALSNIRFRRDGTGAHTVSAVDANVSATYSSVDGLEAAFGSLLAGHTDPEIATAVEYALNYTLNDGSTIFGEDFEAAINALEVFTKLAFEASDQRDKSAGEDPPNPKLLAGSLARSRLTDILGNWAIKNNVKDVPGVGREIAKAIGKGALDANMTNASGWQDTLDVVSANPTAGYSHAELVESLFSELTAVLVSELTTGALEVLSGNTGNAVGFFGGIASETNPIFQEKMLYSEEYEKFHPEKARLIEHVANGIAYGIMESAIADPSVGDAASLAKNIGKEAAVAAVKKFKDFGDGHNLFLYETVKAIGYGASLGAVLVTGENSTENLTLQVTENIAYGVAAGAMEEALDSYPTANIAKVGEAAAYGTAMGTGLAGSLLKDFDRAALAEAVAKGAARGAMEAAADKKANTADNNAELLSLARGTAMGSVLGSIAMSVYNHLDESEGRVQEVIEATAQGTAFGSMTADLAEIQVDGDGNVVLDDKNNVVEVDRGKLDGHQEDFAVEIARAVANGASAGAMFEVTALRVAEPHKRPVDVNSIKTAKSVSYGATIGAILGGDEGPGLASIAVKQATEQGLTEGSLDSVALALGFDEKDVGKAVIQSEAAIKMAIGIGNKDAAADAVRTLSIKAVNPTVEEVRSLMDLYGINPRLTNPGFIFPNPKSSGKDSFLFEEDEIPVVSPI